MSDDFDFVFSLLEIENNRKNSITNKKFKNKLKDFPLYYILSLFCYERKYKGSDIGIAEFGDKIFGETGESKFLKNFMPSLLLTQKIKKKNGKHQIV